MEITLLLALGLSAGPPAVAPPPRPAPPPPIFSVGPFKGFVTAVDGRSVTVRGFGYSVTNAGRGGWRDKTGAEGVALGNPLFVTLPGPGLVLCSRLHHTREVLTLTLATGETMVVRLADQPERRFPAGPHLLAGGYEPSSSTGSSYRLADVRVGDEVIAYCDLIDDVDTCRRVMINRRPGGRVPPAPGQKADDPDPYHEWMNAYQAYEEFGTPLPDRYDSDKIAAEAVRQFQAELPAMRRKLEARAARDRVAPPPRPAQPNPPAPVTRRPEDPR